MGGGCDDTREPGADSPHECTDDLSCIEFIKQHLRHTQMALDREEYVSLYRDAGGTKIVGDASSDYFFNAASPRLIHRMSPGAKILIILRDPVERMFSEYLQPNPTPATFREYANARLMPDPARIVWSWRGYSPVKDWIGTFGRPNVRIVIFEEFVRDQKNAVAGILEWLGLDNALDSLQPRHDNQCQIPRNRLLSAAHRLYMRKVTVQPWGHAQPADGSSMRGIRPDRTRVPPFLRKFLKPILFKTGKKPEMGFGDRVFLRDHYRNDVGEIEAILGRKLPWKNFA